MGYNAIIWSPGYAEESVVSYIISSTHYLHDGEQFDSKEEAIRSLANDLFHKFRDVAAINNETIEKWRGMADVPGRIIKVSYEEFLRYLRRMPGLTTDRYGEAEQAESFDYKFIWSPYWPEEVMARIHENKHIFIQDQAELIFSWALKDKYPDIFDEDDFEHIETEWNKLIKE